MSTTVCAHGRALGCRRPRFGCCHVCFVMGSALTGKRGRKVDPSLADVVEMAPSPEQWEKPGKVAPLCDGSDLSPGARHVQEGVGMRAKAHQQSNPGSARGEEFV
jgi:hypothetical protein